MTGSSPPSLILIFGSLLIPLLKGKLKSVYMLLLPVIAFTAIYNLPEGSYWQVNLLDYVLTFGRIDKLSLVFGYIFILITFIGLLFALKVKDDLQHVAALMYAGCTLGVTFAGDFVSLYIFWELMAVSSTFLILARKTKAARAAAFRYILIHLLGGVILLAGIVMRIHNTGSIEFSYIGLSGLDSWFIFLGIALNAAIPPFHPWLKDAYPEATITGVIFLSALTTKSAVYLLARTFPGTELLIWVGAIMTVYPVFYAMLENNLRRVLSYSLINQVGFMVVGIGIGSELALNGTVAHAFSHILYKGLLFMSVGAVMHMTGKDHCSDLGGLYKTMPLTALFCLIGAASISALPLFSGFVTKSMIISAVGHDKLIAVWFMLQFASAGVLHHAGIKVPFFTFFGHDCGLRPKEPPLNMMLAMGIAAFFCVFLALFPGFLYNLLPYSVEYHPYSASHVVTQLQLLMFAILAFTLLLRSGLYPAEMRAINLDLDFLYRKAAVRFYRLSELSLNGLNKISAKIFFEWIAGMVGSSARSGLTDLIYSFFLPFLVLKGTSISRRDEIKDDIRRSLQHSLYPVGIIILPVLIYLMLLFVTQRFR